VSETCPVAQPKMPAHLRELGALKPTRNMSLTTAVMADHAIVRAKTLKNPYSISVVEVSVFVDRSGVPSDTKLSFVQSLTPKTNLLCLGV